MNYHRAMRSYRIPNRDNDGHFEMELTESAELLKSQGDSFFSAITNLLSDGWLDEKEVFDVCCEVYGESLEYDDYRGNL